MADISTVFIPSGAAGAAARKNQENQAVGSGYFNALLSDAGAKITAKEFATTFVENIVRSLSDGLDALVARGAASHAFPFSSDFEATFGASGPLVDFINGTTFKLKLSAEQNKALQGIAVRNKDITHTPENIQKIAAELKQAGIA